MKTIVALTISLVCLNQSVLADDQPTPTPSPTPAFLKHPARPGSVRWQEQIARNRELQARTDSDAQARAQAKANRRAAATQNQTRGANRARVQAQRQVAAENRNETRNATPHPTSDLMSRMGFSEQDVAAQKAREGPKNAGTQEKTDTTSQTGRQQEQSKPATESGVAANHPSPSPAKVEVTATPPPR